MLKLRNSFVTVLAALMITSLVLSGCGTNGTGGNSSGGNSAAPTTGSKGNAGNTGNAKPQDTGASSGKQAGGTIRVAMATEPDNLDPYLSAATDTGSMMDNVFDGLFEAGENSELVPALAESYQVSEDGLAYTFKLRQGVKFHNGSGLTSKDVDYSYAKLAG